MAITQTEVEKAIRKLDRLSQIEYGRGLEAVMRRSAIGEWQTDPATRQLGRLVGIEMKRPFARPRRLKSPNPYSGAKRSWNLVGEQVFNRQRKALKGTPQSKSLDIVVESYRAHVPRAPRETYAIALEVHHEWGWLRELIVWLHPRVCGDKALFNKLRKALGDAGATAIDIAVATQVANVLATVLTGVPMTVLTGVSLFFVRQGAAGACRWARSVDQRNRQLGYEER